MRLSFLSSIKRSINRQNLLDKAEDYDRLLSIKQEATKILNSHGLDNIAIEIIDYSHSCELSSLTLIGSYPINKVRQFNTAEEELATTFKDKFRYRHDFYNGVVRIFPECRGFRGYPPTNVQEIYDKAVRMHNQALNGTH